MNSELRLTRNLRIIRKARNLSIERMSKYFDISPRELSDLEHGKTNVKLDTLESVCAGINIDITRLFEINL